MPVGATRRTAGEAFGAWECEAMREASSAACVAKRESAAGVVRLRPRWAAVVGVDAGAARHMSDAGNAPVRRCTSAGVGQTSVPAGGARSG
eukprot:5833122-Prymnesium_polylepis.2